MKKMYFLLITLLTVSAAQAQMANAVVFSENGEKFTLFLNGEKQNENPQSNVKMVGLTGEFYQARVDFEDTKYPDFSNNNFAVQKGVEVTYMIKVNKKGEYVLRFSSQSEITSTVSPGSTSTATDNEAKRIADVDDMVVEEKVQDTDATIVMDVETPDDEVVQTTTTTTPTKPATGKSGEKVAVGMNIGGVNMGVNIEVSEEGDNVKMDTGVTESTVTTTKTTTTKTGTTTAKTGTTTTAKTGTTTTKPAAKETPAKPKEDVVIVTSTSGCAKSMTPSAFATAKQNVEDKGFDETRLSTAKTIVKANCMTSAQIKEMCDVFGFEETKLAFAKYAYDYCTDQESYYLVNETFGFSSSTDELNKFIESK